MMDTEAIGEVITALAPQSWLARRASLFLIWGLISLCGFVCSKPASAEATKDCVVGAIVAVKVAYELRSAASESSPKVVYESAVRLKGPNYEKVFQGEALKIRGCSGDWVDVSRGWVPAKIIRVIEKDTYGKRIYVENDFKWNQDTSNYKKEVVTIVNKLTREHSKCPTISETHVAKSEGRSRPGVPVFFVACAPPSGSEFNFYFSPTSAGTTTFAATAPIGEDEAVKACERAAKAKARHPSTVSFSRWNANYGAGADGRASVDSSFTTRNSFNLKLDYHIRCLFDGQKMIEATVTEAR